MPGLEVDGDGAFSFSSALIDIASSVVEHAQHGDNAVRRAVGAADVRIGGADIVDGQANAASILRDDGAALESVVNAVNGIFFHC